MSMNMRQMGNNRICEYCGSFHHSPIPSRLMHYFVLFNCLLVHQHFSPSPISKYKSENLFLLAAHNSIIVLYNVVCGSLRFHLFVWVISKIQILMKPLHVTSARITVTVTIITLMTIFSFSLSIIKSILSLNTPTDDNNHRFACQRIIQVPTLFH